MKINHTLSDLAYRNPVMIQEVVALYYYDITAHNNWSFIAYLK